MAHEPSSLPRKPSLTEVLSIVLPGVAMIDELAGDRRSPFTILRWITEAERSRVNGSNGRRSQGAPASKRWCRALGMEPVDALTVKYLLAELGVVVKPAQLVRMFADHAIAVDKPAHGETPLRDDASLTRRIKSFFEAPAAVFVKEHNSRMSRISSSRDALATELSAITNRIWPG